MRELAATVPDWVLSAGALVVVGMLVGSWADQLTWAGRGRRLKLWSLLLVSWLLTLVSWSLPADLGRGLVNAAAILLASAAIPSAWRRMRGPRAPASHDRDREQG